MDGGHGERSRPARHPRLRLLHDDEHLVAIDKPPGYATVSERWNPSAATILSLLSDQWQCQNPEEPRPHVIHRLDRDTSGVLLFARHREAQAEIRRQFRAREVSKSYLAVVVGSPTPAAGSIEISIEKDPGRPGGMRVVKKGGKPCQTRYELVERFHGFALVRLYPRTGRTHQVRISLRELGTPCAVDLLYGGRDALFSSEWIRNYQLGKGQEERPLIDRVTLHAEELTLKHPSSGSLLTIRAELPKDLQVLLKQLRRWRRAPG